MFLNQRGQQLDARVPVVNMTRSYPGFGDHPLTLNAYQSGSVAENASQSVNSSKSETRVMPELKGAYDDLLQQNRWRYQNVLDSFNNRLSANKSELADTYGRYQGIEDRVMNTLGMGQVLGKDGNWGVASPAATAIGQAFAKSRGQTTQNMANAGLGNTTAVAGAQNQNALFAGQAYGALGAQLAQTAAGYQSQLGLAQQAARMQGAQMQTGLVQSVFGPLGQQQTNTFGPLTGQFSESRGSSDSRGYSQSLQNHYPSQGGGPGGYGGPGGGRGGYGQSGGYDPSNPGGYVPPGDMGSVSDAYSPTYSPGQNTSWADGGTSWDDGGGATWGGPEVGGYSPGGGSYAPDAGPGGDDGGASW